MLYRILSATDFLAFERDGEFRGSADDVRDGFIHLSAAHQVSGTLAKHYAGRADLVLVAIREEALTGGSNLRLAWEVSRGGDRFPHLYGALPLQAVVKSVPLGLDGDGRHVVPALGD
jgi:uncharacterized protein (DUF952 family)